MKCVDKLKKDGNKTTAYLPDHIECEEGCIYTTTAQLDRWKRQNPGADAAFAESSKKLVDKWLAKWPRF